MIYMAMILLTSKDLYKTWQQLGNTVVGKWNIVHVWKCENCGKNKKNPKFNLTILTQFDGK